MEFLSVEVGSEGEFVDSLLVLGESGGPNMKEMGSPIPLCAILPSSIP